MLLTALLALIMLTQLDGNPIWVESSALFIVKPSHTAGTSKHVACAHPAGSAIRVDGQALCVKETPGVIRELLNAVKR